MVNKFKLGSIEIIIGGSSLYLSYILSNNLTYENANSLEKTIFMLTLIGGGSSIVSGTHNYLSYFHENINKYIDNYFKKKNDFRSLN